jgi:hypothetical protein
VGSEESSVAVANELKLLHFEGFNFDEWKDKWLGRLDGFSMDKTQKLIVSEFLATFDAHDERAIRGLYNRMYCIPDRELRLLKRLGLAKEIDVFAPGGYR